MMRRARRIAVVAVGLVLALTACQNGETVDQANTATTALTTFGIQLDHPDDLQLQTESDDQAELCFASEQDTRHPRCLRLATNGQAPAGDNVQTMDLDNSGSLTYVTETRDGGSGGAEHLLTGQLTVGGQTIFVTADAAEEAGFEDATWSLPILRTARP